MNTAVKKFLPKRSLGAKAILVCALSLLMTIPALFVGWLIHDRTERSESVVYEVGQLRGGEQRLLGPLLAVPYERKINKDTTTRGYYYLFPKSGTFDAKVTSETLKRSIFEVPVYETETQFTADFDISDIRLDEPNLALGWDRAEIIMGAHDLRGARGKPEIKIGDKTYALNPAGGSTVSAYKKHNRYAAMESTAAGPTVIGATPHTVNWAVMNAPIDLDEVGKVFTATADLRFTGSQSLAIAPYGMATEGQMTADWPHPSFKGGFLPETRDITDNGFTANWQIPFVARGMPQVVEGASLNTLNNRSMTVEFVRANNPYKNVGRSLKYAIVFIGLVFLTFFLFEAMGDTRVHAAQYIMIGLGQVVFYLLLLSISEFWGFDLAFIIAATATVALISAYAGWTFGTRRRGLTAFLVFAGLYGLIYVLMRLEDYALLVGAVVTFLAIATAMILTRNINWYGDDNG